MTSPVALTQWSLCWALFKGVEPAWFGSLPQHLLSHPNGRRKANRSSLHRSLSVPCPASKRLMSSPRGGRKNGWMNEGGGTGRMKVSAQSAITAEIRVDEEWPVKWERASPCCPLKSSKLPTVNYLVEFQRGDEEMAVMSDLDGDANSFLL